MDRHVNQATLHVHGIVLAERSSKPAPSATDFVGQDPQI